MLLGCRILLKLPVLAGALFTGILKINLIYTAHFSQFDHLLNDIYTILAKQISPVQKIREIILNISYQMLKDEDYRAMGILHYNIEKSKEVRCVMSHKIQEQHQWKENPIIELIKEGVNCGEIRVDLNPKLIAKSITLYIFGLVNAILDDIKPLAEKEIEPMVDCFLYGIANSEMSLTGSNKIPFNQEKESRI